MRLPSTSLDTPPESSTPLLTPLAGPVSGAAALSAEPAAPSSVHSQETKSQESVPSSPGDSRGELASDTRFRHSGWAAIRARVFHALQGIGVSDERLNRFAYCGSNAWVTRDRANSEHLRLVADYCHDRFCLPCAQTRSRTIYANAMRFLADRPFRFLTLTIKSGDQPLAGLVDKLYKSFAQLRRTPLWRATVTGGAAFLEIKYFAVTQRWHPHVHCLIEGGYLPHPPLKAHWHRITGDSYIVDIRSPRDKSAAKHYITKYASKPFDGSVLSRPDQLAEAMVAMTGRRTALTFGNWRGARLLARHDDTEWVTVASLRDIRDAAYAGDHAAIRVIQLLKGCDEWSPPKQPTPVPRSPPPDGPC